jgi:hypothetical protein
MSHMPHYPVQSGRNVRVRSGGSFLRSRRRTGFRCTGSASSAARKRPRAEPPAASHIATGHLLRETIYPPGQASDTLATRTVSQAYNALGQVIWMKDQAGNITEFAFNRRGQETMRTFSTIASGFDTRVHAAGTSYTPRGQVARKWQQDNAVPPNIKDDTSMAYDGWGNLTKFVQDVDSEIGADLGRDEFEVAYTYAKATPGGGRPMVRRTGMTSTAGASITYEYLSSGNSLDDAAGRVSRVKQGIVVVARYQYLGQALDRGRLPVGPLAFRLLRH